MNTKSSEQAKLLGKNIKKRREEIGLSQEKLANTTGLDRTYVSGIERGMRNPSLNNIAKLAAGLKVKVSDLINF